MTPPPTVTQEEALNAFRTLGKLLQERYDIPKEALTQELGTSVPASIFRGELPPFASLATYLSQQDLSPREIAKKTARNKTFVKQSIHEDAQLDTQGTPLAVEIFDSDLSVLEAAAWELKQRGLDNSDIARELGKSTSAVWTTLKRAEEKHRGERASNG